MKTKNYLGKHDENRGIVIFCMIFSMVLVVILAVAFAGKIGKAEEDENIGFKNINSIIEEQICDINEFKVENNKLVLEGELKEEITEAIIIKLQDIHIVFKDDAGDKYEYETEYFISDDKIKFSSIIENEKESDINLDKIENGEYIALLRIKYESAKTETGYKYRYYSLRNNSQNNSVNYNNMNIYFDSSNSVESFLKIEQN